MTHLCQIPVDTSCAKTIGNVRIIGMPLTGREAWEKDRPSSQPATSIASAA
jgi:hypothetical protein